MVRMLFVSYSTDIAPPPYPELFAVMVQLVKVRLPVVLNRTMPPELSMEVLLLMVLLLIVRVPGMKPGGGEVLIAPEKRIAPPSPKPPALELLLEMLLLSMVNEPPPTIRMPPPSVPAELPEIVLLRSDRKAPPLR